MGRSIEKLKGVLQDHPLLVTLLAFLAVVTHFFLVLFCIWPNTWEHLAASSDSGVAIYLGSASAAAIVAGFAGVVVVFGLTASGEKFRTVRVLAGKSLGRNWTSSSVSGFAAAGFALAAALLASLGLEQWAPWLFEWSLLLLLHGTIRIIWLLRLLMRVVAQQDAKESIKESEIKVTKGRFS